MWTIEEVVERDARHQPEGFREGRRPVRRGNARKFAEMVAEENRGTEFHVFDNRAHAESWSVKDRFAGRARSVR